MSDTMTLTNDMLKQTMSDAMVKRDTALNIDECLVIGIHQCAGPLSTGTFPDFGLGWDYGAIENIPGRGERVIQRITSERGDCAIRCYLPSTTPPWTGWKRMTS